MQQRRARLPGVLVVTAMSGFFAHFAPFFRAPPVIPELSANFFEPSTMKSSSLSRAPWSAGVAGSFTPK